VHVMGGSKSAVRQLSCHCCGHPAWPGGIREVAEPFQESDVYHVRLPSGPLCVRRREVSSYGQITLRSEAAVARSPVAVHSQASRNATGDNVPDDRMMQMVTARVVDSVRSSQCAG